MKNKIRHFLRVSDLSTSELQQILKSAQVYKKNRQRNLYNKEKKLLNRTFGLLFQKSSTRTRVSFEVGIREMGGTSIFLDHHNLQLGRGESLSDTLLVLERYLSGMVIRNHDHKSMEEVSHHIQVSLINGLSEIHHPAQGVADALTVIEKTKSLHPKIAYLGEGNNVTASLIEICSLLKWPLVIASPQQYAFPSKFLSNIMIDEKYVSFTENPLEAVRDAEVVYTDTWFSMTGNVEEDKKNLAKKKVLHPYQVNPQLLRSADPNYMFLHCLPAYREQEVTSDIIDGPHSAVFEQAENRLHAQKALMHFFWNS